MIPAPQVGRYTTRRSDEQFLRFCPNFDIQILLIEGLLEERNFLRKPVVDLARTFAARGIGVLIPDLPGCGESPLAIGDVTFSDWHCAIADVTELMIAESGQRPHIAAIRGGALLDHAANGASWWRFAPASGADLLRPLRRAQRLRDPDDGDGLAGYAFRPDMIADVESAIPRPPSGPYRECAAKSAGSPLWRRAEPSDDPVLVQMLADDLASWVRTCAAA